jgi:hypothetical protein
MVVWVKAEENFRGLNLHGQPIRVEHANTTEKRFSSLQAFAIVFEDFTMARGKFKGKPKRGGIISP